MQPLLIDEGLPASVAAALAALELSAHAVGQPGAPGRQSPDEINCQWCQRNGAVLVTQDRGKRDKTIFSFLATYRVHAIFVHDELRNKPVHILAKALLLAEGEMDQLADGRGLIQRRLRPKGKLEKRG